MSSDGLSPLEKVLAQITDPWDWVAAGVGAAAGAAASASVGGADLGASIATGAVGAVTAKKSAAAAFVKRRLQKRASALEEILERGIFSKSPSNSSGLTRLRETLGRERELWLRGATSTLEFERQLDLIVEAYRQFA